MYNQVKKSLIFRKFFTIVLIKQLTLCFIFALLIMLALSTQYAKAGEFDLFVLEASGEVKSYQMVAGTLNEFSYDEGSMHIVGNPRAIAIVRDIGLPGDQQYLCVASDAGLHVFSDNGSGSFDFLNTFSGDLNPVDPVDLVVGLKVVSSTPVIVTDKVNFVVTGTRFIDYRTSPEKKTEYWNEKYVSWLGTYIIKAKLWAKEPEYNIHKPIKVIVNELEYVQPSDESWFSFIKLDSATEGDGTKGSKQTIDIDYSLSSFPDEAVDVEFVIDLLRKKSFKFYVDVEAFDF